MPQSYPGSTPGIDPRSQGVIPRRFKRKKNCDERTDKRKDGRTDRRDGRNSDLDWVFKHSGIKCCADIKRLVGWFKGRP